ncbi:MAG: hypothetical protein LBT62_05080 [Deltaproteobacteria bacterium]|nr:hypothetical protein [Deltaproteobacteria bacterium]
MNYGFKVNYGFSPVETGRLLRESLGLYKDDGCSLGVFITFGKAENSPGFILLSCLGAPS